MITITYSTKFIKERSKFVKNNTVRVKAVQKSLLLFAKDYSHPSLNTEKLQNTDIWTIRIDKGNRMFFIWVDTDTVLFIDIGAHDNYRSY